jgi:two-component system CheB/CheR fusion protein
LNETQSDAISAAATRGPQPPPPRTLIGTIRAHPLPMVLLWGSADFEQIGNDAAARLLDAPAPWPRLTELVLPHLDRITQGKPCEIGEVRWGNDRYLTIHCGSARNENGDIGGVLLTLADTTAARQGEEQLRLLTNALPTLISYVGADHRYRFNNRAYQDWFRPGNGPGNGEPLTGRHMREVLGEDIYQHRLPYIDRVLAGETVQFEGPTRHGTQGLRDTEVLYVPDRGDDGAVRGFVVLVQDITERRRDQRALGESETRFREMFEQTPIGMVVNDLDGHYVHVNPAYCRIVGYSRDELLDPAMRVRSVVHPDDRERMLALQAKVIAGESNAFFLEKRYVRKDGSIVWVRVSGTARRDAQGRPIQLVRLVEDINDRKLAETELEHLLESERQARAEAERASEAKSEFLATLSHELRTPLTPVLLTVSLMESNPTLPEALREDVATIRRNVELESRLISDLLDLTRITRGKLQLDLQDVDLHLIVRSAIDICQREASAKLVVDLGAKQHIVHGDSTRLQQIFWNLVNNAIKFTGSDGTITVRSTNTEDGRIRVEVSDTGIGIEPDVLPRLFNAFEQGNVRAAQRFAGLGLGLAISKKLVEVHGGTITAHSAGRGRGATFAVELPALILQPRPQSPPRASGASMPRESVSVLLIEDHEPTLLVLSKLLRLMGHRVTAVTSVASALAAARQDRFDLIISDLGLPDGSGLDVMRHLRNEYSGRAIALTGYGMESDIAASRDSGFAEHLTKPVDLNALQAAIGRVISRLPRPRPTATS